MDKNLKDKIRAVLELGQAELEKSLSSTCEILAGMCAILPEELGDKMLEEAIAKVQEDLKENVTIEFNALKAAKRAIVAGRSQKEARAIAEEYRANACAIRRKVIAERDAIVEDQGVQKASLSASDILASIMRKEPPK